MKRRIACLLAVMLLLAAAGCAGAGRTEETNTYQKPAETKPHDSDTFPDFKETVLVDNDACTVKVTGMRTDSVLGVVLDLYLENKTKDRSLYFSFEDAAVNGVKWYPFFATLIPAETGMSDYIAFFDKEKLDLLGTFTDVELTLLVYEENNRENGIVASGIFHLYPYGEEKASIHVRQPKATDNVIVDNDDVTIVVTGYDPYRSLGYTVKLFFVNKTDKDVILTVRSASINGKDSNPWFTISVQPGKMAYDNISWMDYTFKEGQSVSVKKIEIRMVAEDRYDLYAPYFYEGTFTLNP